MSDAEHRLTVVGDRTGSFVIEEELPDGRLVIRPEVAPSAPEARPGRAMTQDELEIPVEEALCRARPLPPYPEMVIEDLSEEEAEAFFDAVNS